MSQLWTWLLGLGIVGYLVIRWFQERTYRNNMSNFYNSVLDSKITERDEAIKNLTEAQAKTLEEYYAKHAKYHNDLLRDPNRNEGKGD